VARKLVRYGVPAGVSTLLGVGVGVLTNVVTSGWTWPAGAGLLALAGGWIAFETWQGFRQGSGVDSERFHQERTPRLDARVTTHLAVRRSNGMPLHRLELRLLGPCDLDELEVHVEDGRWLAFTGNQEGVTGPLFTGFAADDFSPEATLISHRGIWKALRVGGRPASWQVQLATIPLTTGDHAPVLRVRCRSGKETWDVAVPVRDSHIVFDHPIYKLLVHKSIPYWTTTVNFSP
jgi:hypothetical protein